jgi:hypothetical protein
MTEEITEVVIPREEAVFWMDKNGRWHNKYGEFKNRKIREYFHRAIEKDENGYYVTQVRGNVREKVYFPYEDTAFFVVDVKNEDGVTLVLNTGRHVPLDAERLFVKDDSLYLQQDGDLIKFTDRGLLKISEFLDFRDDRYFIRIDGRTVAIPEKD